MWRYLLCIIPCHVICVCSDEKNKIYHNIPFDSMTPDNRKMIDKEIEIVFFSCFCVATPPPHICAVISSVVFQSLYGEF
jgi:hypothetical protein